MTHGLRAHCSSPFALIHPRIWVGGGEKGLGLWRILNWVEGGTHGNPACVESRRCGVSGSRTKWQRRVDVLVQRVRNIQIALRT